MCRKPCFNPRPALWPGATTDLITGDPISLFQSSPGTLAGRYLRPRPSRTQRLPFQSSPGTLAGRYLLYAIGAARLAGFNPRPALWPGATREGTPRYRHGGVSILARHSGRALHSVSADFQSTDEVSILARHSGRALPRVSRASARSREFQSSPGTLAGRYPPTIRGAI